MKDCHRLTFSDCKIKGYDLFFKKRWEIQLSKEQKKDSYPPFPGVSTATNSVSSLTGIFWLHI